MSIYKVYLTISPMHAEGMCLWCDVSSVKWKIMSGWLQLGRYIVSDYMKFPGLPGEWLHQDKGYISPKGSERVGGGRGWSRLGTRYAESGIRWCWQVFGHLSPRGADGGHWHHAVFQAGQGVGFCSIGHDGQGSRWHGGQDSSCDDGHGGSRCQKGGEGAVYGAHRDEGCQIHGKGGLPLQCCPFKGVGGWACADVRIGECQQVLQGVDWWPQAEDESVQLVLMSHRTDDPGLWRGAWGLKCQAQVIARIRQVGDNLACLCPAIDWEVRLSLECLQVYLYKAGRLSLQHHKVDKDG